MKILEIDIETAPHMVYTWGLFKQNISISQIIEPSRLLCFAARWQDQNKTMFWSEQDGRGTMIQELWELLDKADAVLHFNGKRFDMPHINREFVEQGLTPPSPYKQIDLYQTVRSSFRFASNKMQHVLGRLQLGSKDDTKFDLWIGCMNGVKKAWRDMKRYNIQDVKLLRPLYLELQPWIKGHPNWGLYVKDVSEPTCPTCGSQDVRIKAYRPATTRVSWYPQYLCKDCGTYSRGRTPIKRNRDGILT